MFFGPLDLGLGLLHVVTGLFFVVTGARKVFLPDVRASVTGLLTKQGIPYALAFATVMGEFLGGLGLLFGVLTHVAALGLIPIMVGAYKFGAWPGVKAKQAPGSYWMGGPNDNWPAWSKLISNALCTPEAQLLLIVATLALTGAGAFSVDALIWS